MNTAEDLEKCVSDLKLPDKFTMEANTDGHRQPQETGVYLAVPWDVGLRRDPCGLL